jgi:hypothetical protein
LQKPIWLFIIGMLILLFAVFLKITDMLQFFQKPMFIIGLLIEGTALFTFLRKKFA